MAHSVGERTAGASDLPQAIFRHWIHSREEDGGDFEVFRPEGYTFPPSFGRDGFEMLRDRQFIQEDVGPADGVVQVVGRWTSFGAGRVSVSFEGTAREGFSFEVVAVDDSILRIRREARQEQLLDFGHAVIVTLRSSPPQFGLRVSGTKPYANMDVRLVPVVYITQPEYWRIEVVGSLSGVGLPALAPYDAHIPLAGIIGTKGIEVAGATSSQQFDISSGGVARA